MTLNNLCQSIKLILSDVDGVLTDGRLTFNDEGIETKSFHARDGMGIKLWQKAGYPFGLVTARTSQIVHNRAVELDIDLLRQGVKDKREVVQQVCDELDLKPEQVCFIGDDLPDVRAMQYVGLAIAPADASTEAKEVAQFVTEKPGGRGAVREAITLILQSQGRWNEVIREFQI
ncbi:MAG: HAD-IIIA family hydrolase [Planctomycetia bacterium]|jgi:YrbI family 3-deoxy-D-manno-octulosonate 8-phosphate phosphatase